MRKEIIFMVMMIAMSIGVFAISEKDTLEFDTLRGVYPTIINVSDEVFAIAYQGQDDDAFLKTISVDSGGNINNSVIDTLEFNISNPYYPTMFHPSMIHVSGDYYAIAYGGADSDMTPPEDGPDGFIVTVNIQSNGTIESSIEDSLEYDLIKGETPDLIYLSNNLQNNYYAVTYNGPDDDGYIKTFTIATNNGSIGAVIDTYEFNNITGKFPEVIHIFGTIYAITYAGNNFGYVETIIIENNGSIEGIIDSLAYCSNGSSPDIIHVSDEVYAIADACDDSDGYIKTIKIHTNGSIDDTVIDSLEYDDDYGVNPHIGHISGDLYVIGYNGDFSANGTTTQVTIDTAGDITFGDFSGMLYSNSITSYIYDVDAKLFTDIIQISENIFAVTYQGTDNDGFVKTLNMSTFPLLTIHSPITKTYTTSSVLISFSAFNYDSIWWNDGTTNITYTAPVYHTFSDGGHTIYAWANNTFGTTEKSVSFTVDTSGNGNGGGGGGGGGAPSGEFEVTFDENIDPYTIMVVIDSYGREIYRGAISNAYLWLNAGEYSFDIGGVKFMKTITGPIKIFLPDSITAAVVAPPPSFNKDRFILVIATIILIFMIYLITKKEV